MDFIEGAATGELTNIPSVGGVIAADYVGFGDARDIVIEGTKLALGDDYDQITLGLSLVGLATSATIVAMSAGTVATGGAAAVVAAPILPVATAIDTGASLVKTANKMKRLSTPLSGHISRISAKLIDVDGLKKGLSGISMPSIKRPSLSGIRKSFGELKFAGIAKGDFTGVRQLMSEMVPLDIGGADKALKGAIRGDAVGEAKSLAISVGSITTSGGLKTGFRALEHADDAKELSKFQKLATKMKTRTAPVIKILGKGAVRLGKLAYLIVTVLIAVSAWVLAALWFSYSLARTVRRMVVIRRRATA